MKAFIRDLIEYRELLYMLTWRDLRVKYKQSLMGFLWAIFMPIIIIFAGILIKFAMSRMADKPMDISDIVTVCVKSIPWAFFAASIRGSASSLISNTQLVTKVYFPRIVLPISSIFSQFVDFLVAASLLIILLGVMRIGVSVHLLWIPVLMIILIIFTCALGMLLAATNLFYHDVGYLINAILTFGIFFTPVYYETTKLGKIGTILLLNPVAVVLEAINDCVVYQQVPNIGWVLYSVAVSLIGIWISLIVFYKLEPKFAENI